MALCSDQVQALHKQLGIGLFQASTVGSQSVESRGRCRQRGTRTFMAAPVYWHLVHRSLPFGRLDIGVLWKEADDVSDEARDGGSWAARIVVTFIPPNWLSNNMLEYILEARGCPNTALPSLGINMNPKSVNHNPLLRRALDENDLASLRGLVSDRLARPNDHVLDSWGRSVSLLDVSGLYPTATSLQLIPLVCCLIWFSQNDLFQFPVRSRSHPQVWKPYLKWCVC